MYTLDEGIDHRQNPWRFFHAPSHSVLFKGNGYSDLYPYRLVLSVFEFDLNGILQYVLFCHRQFFLMMI